MVRANWHTYQVLTKRAERMALLLRSKLRFAAEQPHIWWGVSVEDRQHGLPRIDSLRSSPAKIRFLSVEPLLENIGPMDLTGIDWVIVGGESGRGARPMNVEWVRQLRSDCHRQSVAFFFKQWGGVNKAKTGRVLDGRTYDEFPKRPRR
jgi:protein gp37